MNKKIPIYISFLLLIGCVFRSNSTVKVVNLSNRKLAAIPDSIYSLEKLEYLNLGNSITVYPPLSALTSEDNLNQITQISEKISQLHQLKVLNVCANDLRSLPKGLLELRMLDTLDISHNKNLQIANELEILSKMTWLKCLNITGTNTDQNSIDEIKNSLSTTKIIVNLDEMIDHAMIDSIINSPNLLQSDSSRIKMEAN